MTLSKILDAQALKVLSAVTSKKRLFQELGDVLGNSYDLKPQTVAEALQERESLGPTGVGQGIALPHARLDGLTHVVGSFIRLERAVDFESVDRQPVDLVFALLAPQDAGVEHLKALALVSRTMRNVNLCAKLRSNTDPATLHTILTDGSSAQAA